MTTEDLTRLFLNAAVRSFTGMGGEFVRAALTTTAIQSGVDPDEALAAFDRAIAEDSSEFRSRIALSIDGGLMRDMIAAGVEAHRIIKSN